MKKLLHRVLPFVFVILFCLSANLPIAAASLCADADGDGEITLRDALCVLADPSMAKAPAGATDAARRILRAAATDAPKCGVFYENDFSDPETLADFTAYRGKWSIRSGKLWLDSMDDDSVESSAFLLYSGAETMHLKNYRIDVDIFDVQTQCGVLARCDDAFIRSDAPSNGFRGYYGFVGADADKCAIGYGNAGNGWGGNISTGDAYYLRRGENLHLTMTVFGDRIFATFTNLATGRIEASLVGANGAWTRGGFGFRMRNKYGKTVAVGNTAFDNLRVTVIDESGLPTAENRSIGHIDNNVTDVLFIGNSYTYVNNLPSMVFEMTVAAGVDASFAMFANGGYSLREFYEDLQNGDAEMKEMLREADIVIFQDYGGATTYSADYIELLASRLDPCVKLYFYPYKNATAPRAALDRFIDLGLPVTVIRTPDLYQSTLTKYKVNYLMNDGPKHPQPILSHLFAMQIAATVFGIDPAKVDHSGYISALSSMTSDEQAAFFADVCSKIEALRTEPLPHS